MFHSFILICFNFIVLFIFMFIFLDGWLIITNDCSQYNNLFILIIYCHFLCHHFIQFTIFIIVRHFIIPSYANYFLLLKLIFVNYHFGYHFIRLVFNFAIVVIITEEYSIIIN